MKVVEVSKNGVSTASARVVTATSDGRKFYCLTHGQTGRGRWQVRIPLAAREFPVQNDEPLELTGDFKLVPLNRKDARGNDMFLLARGEDDNTWLVLWSLDPGFRGGADYEVQGQARTIALGEEAQGEAGRMGGAYCPIVLVTGPCQLLWHRTGRLYGEPADWVAVFDGHSWKVGPSDQCSLEEAALNY